MNLKVSPFYILAFLLLLFLVHEIHDWMHVLAVRGTCHCWPVRLFGSWEICGSPSAGQHAIIDVAGPLINVLLYVAAWNLLDPENSADEYSLGVALLFAPLPWNDLIAAFSGGGEITDCIRWMQKHGPQSNRSFAGGLGLVIQLALILPPLVRAFRRLPGYKGRLIAFPLFLLLPVWLDKHWNQLLNQWFIPAGSTLWHGYIVVGAWFVLLLAGFLLTRRHLKGLITELSL